MNGTPALNGLMHRKIMFYLQWAVSIVFEYEDVPGGRDFTIGSILRS